MSEPVIGVRQVRCDGSPLYRATGGKDHQHEGFGITEAGAIGALLIGKPQCLGLTRFADSSGMIFSQMDQPEKIRLKWSESDVRGLRVYVVKACLPENESSEDDPYGSGSSPAEALGNLVKENLELFGIAPG